MRGKCMKGYVEKLFISDVLIIVIRFDDLYYYKVEGFGGKEIEKWPVYHFFCEYINGDKDEAHKNFTYWYIDQFINYCDKPKNLGGMYKGSLYTLIENEYSKQGMTFDCETIKNEAEKTVLVNAVEKRVAQRFQMLESIACEGFIPNQKSLVCGVKRGDSIYLKGGHHRVAALKALGYQKVPRMVVYPNDKFLQILQGIRRSSIGNILK